MLLDRRIAEQDETNSGEVPLALRPGMHLHLVGIAGSGISAIAWVLLGRGYVVSGSDLQESELTAALAAEGATITQGHAAENVKGADAVVVSRVVRMIVDGVVMGIDGTPLPIHPDTICVHGDTPGAGQLAAALRDGLKAAGISVGRFD